MTELTTPACEHWIFGDITVQEQEGSRRYLHRYERAILVTFATIDEYRAALRYFEPVFSSHSAPLETK